MITVIHGTTAKEMEIPYYAYLQADVLKAFHNKRVDDLDVEILDGIIDMLRGVRNIQIHGVPRTFEKVKDVHQELLRQITPERTASIKIVNDALKPTEKYYEIRLKRLRRGETCLSNQKTQAGRN